MAVWQKASKEKNCGNFPVCWWYLLFRAWQLCDCMVLVKVFGGPGEGFGGSRMPVPSCS